MMTRAERFVPYAFLLPAFAGLLLFHLLPIVYSLGRSFFTTVLGSGSLHFSGLENYLGLFSDPVFWKSLGQTLLFNLIVNPLQTALALGLALLVNVRLPGIGLFRSVFFIPVGVSLAVASVLWGMVLDSQSGLLNGLLIGLGLPPQPFLDNPGQALGSIVAIASWKGVGYWMIFFLAGLQGIPRSLYEAAAIDGASPLRSFFAITLPLLRRTTAFVLIADTAANFLLFVPVAVLTGGGPVGATNFLMYESYRSGIVGLDMGRATAITVIILLLLLGTVALQSRFLREAD